MPFVTPSPSIASSAQIAPQTILGSDIKNDEVVDAQIGAHTTTKITVPTTKLSGTVTKAQLATGTQGDLLIYTAAGAPAALGQSTSGKFLKTQGAGADPMWDDVPNPSIYKSLSAVYAENNASGTQNVAHGCGKTPKFVKITALKARYDSTALYLSIGSYDGTNKNQVNYSGTGNGIYTYGTTETIFVTRDAGSNGQKGVVTFDGTNIIITWTKVGTGVDGSGNNIVLLIDVFA